MMLFRIAWRNVWRSKIRSLLVILAVALGLWAGIFMLAFSWGINSQRMRDVIETKISHVQIHHHEFRDDLKAGDVIPETQGNAILTDLKADPRTKAVASRLVLTGMVQSARATQGIQIQGISPVEEAALTQLPDRIVAGKYLEEEGRSMRVLVGAKLMKKLGMVKVVDSPGSDGGDSIKYGLRKSVVLKFLDANGETQGINVKVQGVFKSQDPRLEEGTVFMRDADLREYAGVGNAFHEIAFLLNDGALAEDSTYLRDLKTKYSGLEIMNWKDLAPELKLVDETFATTVFILMGVILLALLFGIINTMMMAILERTRELGMLMAVGMNKSRLFGMIMLETIFLTMIGAPLGLLGGYASISYFGSVGIDISAFSEGLSQFGASDMVYTSIDSGYYLQITVMVIFTALFASIFPARRALRLNPSEAVRSI